VSDWPKEIQEEKHEHFVTTLLDSEKNLRQAGDELPPDIMKDVVSQASNVFKYGVISRRNSFFFSKTEDSSAWMKIEMSLTN
jgi:hypothetical protein